MNTENNMFNAKQAELARQFQEDFYNKYQSPSAMMAQYQDAGINPMLVAGQGAGSPHRSALLLPDLLLVALQPPQVLVLLLLLLW